MWQEEKYKQRDVGLQTAKPTSNGQLTNKKQQQRKKKKGKNTEKDRTKKANTELNSYDIIPYFHLADTHFMWMCDAKDSIYNVLEWKNFKH